MKNSILAITLFWLGIPVVTHSQSIPHSDNTEIIKKVNVNDRSDNLAEAIVFSTLRPPNWNIYLFEKTNGIPLQLTDDSSLDYNAVFSPDGRWVVFTSERSGNADLYALDLTSDSKPIRLTHNSAMDDAATFSADGKSLAFVSSRDGFADIFIMPFDPDDAGAEGQAVNLTQREGGDFNPAFSPDGRYIAFSRQEHLWATAESDNADSAIKLYVMDTDGSNIRRIAGSGPGITMPMPPPGNIRPGVSGSPVWSPDGEAIYYYRLDGDGFSIRRVMSNGSGDEHIVSNGFSPDIRGDGRIAFVQPSPKTNPFSPSEGHVYSIAHDGSDLRIESSDTLNCFAPNYDRSSERLVCHGSSALDQYVVFDSEETFAPDGAANRIELADRTVELRGVRGAFPAITASGDVVSTFARTLQVSDIDGNGMRELFNASSGSPWGAASAANIDWIVVGAGPQFADADERVDIWKVFLDGSDPINLTADSPANDALPHVSADGNRIVFRSGRDGNMATYMMDNDGRNVQRLTHTEARETMPALSPDGEWIVITTDGLDPRLSWFQRKLWVQRVDGTEGRYLEPDRMDLPDLSMHPRFSPDGKWVVFTSNRAGLNDEWPLTWFPQPYGEIWAVPVKGGPAVRLTNDKWENGPNDWGYVRLPISSSPLILDANPID